MTPVSVQQLWFTDIHTVDCRVGELAPPGPGEVLVKTHCSAISAGTELLVYRGKIPPQMALDATLESLNGAGNSGSNATSKTSASIYPLQYGYACTGTVIAVGEQTDAALTGQRVFSFQPHVSHFVAPLSTLIPVPDDIPDEAAVFLANMETAVNLLQDGLPMAGENVVVLGQGIVGLLLTALLARFPLSHLLTLDALPDRRRRSLQLGADDSVDVSVAAGDLQAKHYELAGADLIYEVTGVPDALNTAIALSGFESRIVIGSWYGTASAPISLGGDAHRNRLRITTSQVSTLASSLAGRWNKQRRFRTAWEMIRQVKPEQLITHRAALTEAAGIYSKLHAPEKTPGDIMQAVFIYSEDN